MHTSKILFSFLFLFSLCSAQAQTGYWKTVDDNSGETRSVVWIYKTKSGHYAGKIMKLFNPPEPNPVCVECPGDKKDKPIVGLVVISGMQKVTNQEKLINGTILDPENGKEYKCEIWKEGGNLKVKGKHWTGISRTQTWYPTTKP